MGMENGEYIMELRSDGVYCCPNSIHSDHVLRTSWDDQTLDRVRASGCAPARLSGLA